MLGVQTLRKRTLKKNSKPAKAMPLQCLLGCLLELGFVGLGFFGGSVSSIAVSVGNPQDETV